MLYEKFPGVPPYGSLTAAVCLLYLSERRASRITADALKMRSGISAEEAQSALKLYLDRAMRVHKEDRQKQVQKAMKELVLNQSAFKITPLQAPKRTR